jgi:hypothetical protein
LRENGYRLERQGKGDHEFWYNPKTNSHVSLNNDLDQLQSANALLKDAGISYRFAVTTLPKSKREKAPAQEDARAAKLFRAMQSGVGIPVFEVSKESLPEGARSVLVPAANIIKLDQALSLEEKTKTYVQEWARSRFYDQGQPEKNALGEMQAENAAYMVCNRFGLDTGNYSFQKLEEAWTPEAQSSENIKSAVNDAFSAAQKLINTVEKQLNVIDQGRDMSMDR